MSQSRLILFNSSWFIPKRDRNDNIRLTLLQVFIITFAANWQYSFQTIDLNWIESLKSDVILSMNEYLLFTRFHSLFWSIKFEKRLQHELESFKKNLHDRAALFSIIDYYLNVLNLRNKFNWTVVFDSFGSLLGSFVVHLCK